jgi:hypothetical protein
MEFFRRRDIGLELLKRSASRHRRRTWRGIELKMVQAAAR